MLIILSLSASTPSYSSDKALEGLRLCDLAVMSCKAALDAKEAETKVLHEAVESASKRVQELEVERASVWNSKWLWLGIGLAVGGVAVGIIK